MLVGRDEELAALSAAIRAAAAGRGSALLVAGEPGIGKTALLAAVGGGDGVRSLRAAGVEPERAVPYATLHALLWPLRDGVEQLERGQRALVRGILELGPTVGGSSFAVGAAALALLSLASESRPHVLIVDDAHWADEGTQEVLCFVARRLEHERVALLAGLRAGEACMLAGERAFTRIELGALSKPDSRRLLESSSAGELAPPVAERVLSLCAGNPLGLVELPRLLSGDQRRGLEPLPDVLAVGPLVERAFAARVAQLGEDAQTALLLLAAAEGEAALDAMTASERAALDEAEAAGLVSRSGPAEFRHPLLRAAVYAGADPVRRRLAHRRLADAAGGARRAWHLAAAAEGPSEAVAEELEQAARQGGAGGRGTEAEALERAAALTPDHGRRAGRLLLAARAWRSAGRAERAGELLAQALPHAADARTRAEIQLERGAMLVRSLELAAAQELLRREADLAAPTEPQLAARLLCEAALCADLGAAVGLANELAERAYGLAEGGDLAAELDAVNALVTVRTSTGAPPGERDAELVERAAHLLADPSLRAGSEAAHWIAYCLALHERDDEARGLSDLALGEARAAGDVWALCFGLYARAAIEQVTGRIDAMDAWLREAVPLAEQIAEPWRLIEARTFLVSLAAERGDPDGCRRALESRGGVLAPEQEPLIAGYHMGRAYLGRGLAEQAIPELEHAARHLQTGGILVWYRMIPLELAESYASAGRLRDARAAVRAAAPGIERAGLRRPLARLARTLALLAPDARVDAEFSEAAALAEQARHPLDHARLQLCWGERLRATGRTVEAAVRLERALAGFDSLGADGWAHRARRELEAASGRERPALPRRSDALTAQELRVARHAAAGLRNREIAALLYLSPRTVESHLQSAYRKLDVGNRTQLAAVLAAEGVRPIAMPTDSVAPVP